MATQQAWLDVPPRRRVEIPARDVVLGVALGVGLCAVGMVLAASLQPPPPPPSEAPLTVSIGVLATNDPGPGGGGSKRTGKAGKRRGRKDAAASPPSASEPVPPRAASSTSTVPAISVPSPEWETPAGLPGLDELGDPVEGTEEGEGEGEGEGGTGEGDGSGEGAGHGGGTGDGGLGAYRSQLAAWLAAHFHVEGSGLDAKTLSKLRVRAVLELSEDRVVTDYSVQATGTAAVDDAARRALEAVKGQPVPAPPASLGSLQRRIHVVLTCRPDTCN